MIPAAALNAHANTMRVLTPDEEDELTLRRGDDRYRRFVLGQE